MKTLSYERLTNIKNTTNPYRGSHNRFPLFSRSENTKYFVVGQKNGETIFNIVYGNKYERQTLTKEQYDAYTEGGKPTSSHGEEYWMYATVPNVIGRVYPDNTFEFLNSYYGQGDCSFLQRCSKGYFSNDSRRGGLIYWEGNKANPIYMTPIYRGMRVSCDTMNPTQEFEVIGKSVDRKLSKALMAKHKQFFVVSETMSKVMDMDTFLDTAKSIYEEYGGGLPILKRPSETKMEEIALGIMGEKPLDAMVLYMIATNAGRVGSFVHSSGIWGRPASISDAYAAMKRKMIRSIYVDNESIFKNVEYKNGSYLPPSDWGYELCVNGKQVEQCGA